MVDGTHFTKTPTAIAEIAAKIPVAIAAAAAISPHQWRRTANFGHYTQQLENDLSNLLTVRLLTCFPTDNSAAAADNSPHQCRPTDNFRHQIGGSTRKTLPQMGFGEIKIVSDSRSGL